MSELASHSRKTLLSETNHLHQQLDDLVLAGSQILSCRSSFSEVVVVVPTPPDHLLSICLCLSPVPSSSLCLLSLNSLSSCTDSSLHCSSSYSEVFLRELHLSCPWPVTKCRPRLAPFDFEKWLAVASEIVSCTVYRLQTADSAASAILLLQNYPTSASA